MPNERAMAVSSKNRLIFIDRKVICPLFQMVVMKKCNNITSHRESDSRSPLLLFDIDVVIDMSAYTVQSHDTDM